MADNTVTEAVTVAGDTFAADDIAGIKFPRTKLIHGADGVNAGDVSTANPLPVTLRDSVGQKAPSSAVTSVAASASSVTLLASNGARLGATVYNDSTSDLYIKFGATASTSSYTVALGSFDYYEVPFGYTGVIDAIWISATGNARITEVS